MINPRGCRGLVTLIVGPFLIAIALAMPFVGETAQQPLSTRVLFGGIGLFLAGGWLFVLSAWVPDRWGRGIARVAYGALAVSCAVTTVGLFWEGVRRLGDDTGVGIGFLVFGTFLIVVLGLLVFRNRLPWNKGVPTPTGRDLRTRIAGSMVLLAEHGASARVHLDTTMPLREVRNAAGELVLSRVAWMLEEAGEQMPPPLALDGDLLVPPGHAIVIEHAGAGSRVGFLLDRDGPVVGSLRARASGDQR